jgi:hypothetical protein
MTGPLVLPSTTPTDPLQAASKGYVDGAASVLHGQVRFGFVDGNTVRLMPYNGNRISIAAKSYAVPAGGVSGVRTNCFIDGVAGQTLTAAQVYFVYAFINAGAVALDFSIIGHGQWIDGVEVKNADQSRTLVGMVLVGGDNAFHDDVMYRLVASWFNRRSKPFVAAWGTAVVNAVGGGVYGWYNTVIGWAGDTVQATYTASCSSNNNYFGGIVLYSQFNNGASVAMSSYSYSWAQSANPTSVSSTGAISFVADGAFQIGAGAVSQSASNNFTMSNNNIYGSVWQ